MLKWYHGTGLPRPPRGRMKLKQARRSRKHLLFFRSAYSFRPPFSVIVDGTAIQASLNLRLVLDEELPKLMGGKVCLQACCSVAPMAVCHTF